MTLVNGVEMLNEARRAGYAVAGFDIFDVESVRAVVAAAESERAPVFMQACVRSVQHLGFRATLMMREEAQRAKVPVAVHFDHGAEITSLESIRQAVELGFTSVMVDGSRLSLAENIALTKAAAVIAHAEGAGIEGEIGQVGRVTGGQADEVARQMAHSDDPRDWLTSPEDAARMAAESEVDYLAISVGSVSGQSSRLDLSRLRDLSETLPIPLVLHGGSGVPAEDMRQAVALGIAKVNIAHAVRRAYIRAVRDDMSTGNNTDNPYRLLDDAREAMTAYMAGKIRELRGG